MLHNIMIITACEEACPKKVKGTSIPQIYMQIENYYFWREEIAEWYIDDIGNLYDDE